MGRGAANRARGTGTNARARATGRCGQHAFLYTTRSSFLHSSETFFGRFSPRRGRGLKRARVPRRDLWRGAALRGRVLVPRRAARGRLPARVCASLGGPGRARARARVRARRARPGARAARRRRRRPRPVRADERALPRARAARGARRLRRRRRHARLHARCEGRPRGEPAHEHQLSARAARSPRALRRRVRCARARRSLRRREQPPARLLDARSTFGPPCGARATTSSPVDGTARERAATSIGSGNATRSSGRLVARRPARAPVEVTDRGVAPHDRGHRDRGVRRGRRVRRSRALRRPRPRAAARRRAEGAWRAVLVLQKPREREGAAAASSGSEIAAASIVEAHRALGAAIARPARAAIAKRLASRSSAALARELDGARSSLGFLEARGGQPARAVPEAVRRAVDEHVASLDAWADGAGLARLAKRHGARAIELAAWAQDDSGGCQTGALRLASGDVLAWHTEEDTIGLFDEPRVVTMRVGGVARSAFLYPYLLPGPAFGWQRDRFHAVDTLHVDRRRTGAGALTSVASWLGLAARRRGPRARGAARARAVLDARSSSSRRRAAPWRPTCTRSAHAS